MAISKISIKNILKIIFRTYVIRLLYNYKNMFGEGLCYCTIPCHDDKNQKRFIRENIAFFNSNEYVVSYAIGAFLKMEQEETIEDTYKVMSMFSSSTGAIGDRLAYKVFYPLFIVMLSFIVISGDFSLNKVEIGIILFILFIYNLFNFFVRYIGIKHGYERGKKVMFEFKNKKFIIFVGIIKRVKLFMVGFSIVLLLSYLLN